MKHWKHFCTAVLLGLLTSMAWAQNAQPNIVMILVDDLSNFETTPASMPKLHQHIVDKGVELTKFYVPQSLCCPARSSFLTSQSSHKSGMVSNEMEQEFERVYFGGAAWFRYLGLDQDTVATRLQAAGYYTAFSGSKYLNNAGLKLNAYTATSISLAPDPAYIPPGWTAWYSAYANSTPPGTPPDQMHTGYKVLFKSRIGTGPVVYEKVVNGVNPNANNYTTDLVFNRAKADIDRAGAQPFFVNVWTSSPHSPYMPATRHMAECAANVQEQIQTPSLNEANVADKAPPMRYEKLNANKMQRLKEDYNRRLCTLKAIDEGVENLINHLALVPGRLENTYVVFVSDNGFLLGRHRRYGKSIAYEESARVPIFVRGPGVPGAGVPANHRRASGLTTMLDLPVTFLDIAGAAPGPLMEGRSVKQAFLQPTVFNNTGSTRKVVLLEGNTSGIPAQAVTSTNGLVATDCSILPPPTANSTAQYVSEYARSRRNYWGLRTDQFTYIRYCNSDGQGHASFPPEANVMLAYRELYDNVADRWQVASLLEQPPHIDGNRTNSWSVATGQLPQAVNPYFVKELDDRIEALKSCTTVAACKVLEDAPFVQPLY